MVKLLAEGFGMHIPRGYIYGAMGFSALVECLSLWAKRHVLRQIVPDWPMLRHDALYATPARCRVAGAQWGIASAEPSSA